jgi:hypothetical protein
MNDEGCNTPNMNKDKVYSHNERQFPDHSTYFDSIQLCSCSYDNAYAFSLSVRDGETSLLLTLIRLLIAGFPRADLIQFILDIATFYHPFCPIPKIIVGYHLFQLGFFYQNFSITVTPITTRIF